MTGGRLADGIETRFVLPVIVTAPQHQAWLGPNDLGSNGEATDFKAFGDGSRMDAGMPDVGNVTWKQSPRFPPVRTVVVSHRAGSLSRRHTGLIAPARVVL